MDSKNELPETTHVEIHDWKTATNAVRTFVKERDWEQFHSVKELIVGLNVEAGELLEETLWLGGEALEEMALERSEKRKAILDESADVLFFLIRLLDKLGADPWKALQNKIEKNREKYPVERAKGRSDKYTAYED